ncbi:MAG: hypothetical protein QT01_C0001G0051 [archaeon GW2011_AR6]|nr:MAG: hypothetical protein QT01_C0001G0051 [archaeon GW2011_AR6]
MKTSNETRLLTGICAVGTFSLVGLMWQPIARIAETEMYGLRKEVKTIQGYVVYHNKFRIDCENPYADSSGLNYVDKFVSLIDLNRDGLVDKIVIETSAAFGDVGPVLISYEDIDQNEPMFEKYRALLEKKGILEGRKISGTESKCR